jgi:SpoVK/Ycf46/Vps4 family AAA+-type ATPase
MIINLKDSKGRRLESINLDIEGIVAEAERSSNGDPVSKSSLIIQELVREKGYDIKEDGLLSLQTTLGKSLADGVFPTDLIMIADKLKNLYKHKGVKVPVLNSNSLPEIPEIFESIIEYPNERAEKEYQSLVGLDDLKNRLTKEGSLLLSSGDLEKWSKKHHKNRIISACVAFEKRLPLVIFGGDIGTGKTALAESFGDSMAKLLKIKIYLLRISVQTRGSGLVGEMTQLINKAFREAGKMAQETQSPMILLIDEADTLAQSREATQMHHEDKAGVNALIQGIDHTRTAEQPILVIFCTNRLGAIDPAIIRRAAILHEFNRPNQEQLKKMFEMYFKDIGLTDEQIMELVKIASPTETRNYGFTYSDIVNKVVPNAIMEAYPDNPLTFENVLTAVKNTQPTPPFKENYDSK